MCQSSFTYTSNCIRLQLSCSSELTGPEFPASNNAGSPLMHASGTVNIQCRAAALFTQFAAYSQQSGPQQVFLSASTQRNFHLLNRRTPAPKHQLVTVSRATVPGNGSAYPKPGNGSAYPKQSVISDRDGTLGPQSRVPTDDMVALNSSVSRPPLTPSVIRSYEVPLWGRSSRRAIPVICKQNEESL